MKNKIGKLLCLLIISFFIIGFGGEKVSALSVYSAGKLNYRSRTWFQHIKSGDNDVFCLNSSKNFTSADYPEVSGLVPANKTNGVIKIIDAGSSLNLNNGLKYYLTQAAVWYYLNGHGQDGITTGFKSWAESNYPTEWGSLVSEMNNEELEPVSISILGSAHKLTEEENGGETTYLISSNFKIDAENIIGNAVVSIDSGSTEGACILYNGECKASVEIAPDNNFKIRVPKPSDASSTVSVDFTATAEGTVKTLHTYGGIDFVGAKWQNLTMLTTDKKEVSAKQNVMGEYVNDVDVSLRKIDTATGKKVANAVLKVSKANGAKVGLYKTTGEGEEDVKVSLPNGEYKMVETKAPDGYVVNDKEVIFSIENGKVKQKNDAGSFEEVASATLSIDDHSIKVKFKKVDKNGNPIAGLKLQVIDYAGAMTGKSKYGLCAVTDENGLLTQDCSESDYKGNGLVKPNSDGIYVIGKDFGESVVPSGYSRPFMLAEECVSDLCRGYDTIDYEIVFAIDRYGHIQSFRNGITIDNSDTSATPIVNVIIENETRIEVSKVDLKTDNRLAGASLVISDKSMNIDQDSSNATVFVKDNIIHEWTSSDGKSEVINGIEFNHKYTITEVGVPEGYIKMYASLDFEVKENGDVVVYDTETGAEIPNLRSTNYELKVPNDYTKVYISKTDMVSGEELSGAKLKICTVTEYEKDGINCNPSKSEWSWESGTEPNYIEMLKPDTYYLIETIAPEGYVRKTSAQKFEVKAESGIQTVVMENAPTKVTISKKDITGENELPGAHLQIVDAATREIAYTNTGVKLEWVSGDKPYEIYGLPAGEYILIETIPPENFAEGMIINDEVVSEFRFTVGETEDDINIDVYVEVLNAPNTGMSTLNIFAIGSLMLFIGYEIIKIYRRKAILK